MSIKLQLGADGKLRKVASANHRAHFDWRCQYSDEPKSRREMALDALKDIAVAVVILAAAFVACWLCHTALTH